MDSAKYIGLDVHKESISIAVLNAAGKSVMECVIETNATLILQFFRGLRGELHATFEEGTSAAWLYDLIQPHVTEVVGCNPWQNALLNHGNKSDRIDAWKDQRNRCASKSNLGDHKALPSLIAKVSCLRMATNYLTRPTERRNDVS
jgi:hypothetical protein